MDKVSFVTWVEEHMDYRAKLILAAVAITALVLLWNHMRDLEHQRELDAKVIATLQQKFEQVGMSAISGNQVGTQREINSQVQQVVDPAVLELMRQQHAEISALTQAQAEIRGQLTTLATQPKEFAGKQDEAGALRGYTLEETRKNLPPTSSVSLFYDPKQKDPNLAFQGTTWQHYDEKFDITLGQWEKKSDGGYKTSLSLSRTVRKADPNDPNKTIVLGTEKIPITGAETIYGPRGLETTAQKIPRWTATLGASKQDGKYYPAGFLDYRITNRFGIAGGFVNKSATAGLSFHFGKP